MAYKPSQTVAWRVLPDGSIDSISTPERNGGSRDTSLGYQASPPSVADFNSRIGNYPYQSLADAQRAQQDMKTQKSIDALRADYDKKLADISSRENTNNALAQQIAALSGGNQPGATIGALGANQMYMGGSPNFNEATGQYTNIGATAQNPAITALSAGNNFATSPLANKLNFQVSDQQILDDYNNTKLSRLNSIVQQGNTQVAGIQQRLTAAQTLLDQLPENDPRYTSSKVYVDQLNSDLKSVTDAITGANTQIKEFKPIAIGTPEAASQITSFREYLQLPEERATQQLRQIDPESYRTSVGLGRQYRQMATQPLGATTTQQTEDLRNTIEQEALNQLRLGSTLGAEERRGYEQAIRGAQTARGNIFGLGPAVQEAAQIGAAGEQRKLARYGAAQQFLGSGETTGAAMARDLALREGLQQNRLGAAANFIGGGPSLYNLGQARTGAQQSAFQNYIQANQALPGQFGQAPSTAQPFYQAVDQGIPVNLTNTFANLYGSQANYLANTYGAQVGAISRQPSGAEQFGQIATGLGNLIKI